MLFNPNWEQPKAKFTLERLIAWLEKQPADKEYDGTDPSICLVAQYMDAHGIYNGGGIACCNFTAGNRTWAKIAYQCRDWTFGAALARAREAIASVTPHE